MAGRRDIDRLQSEIEELFSDLWQIPRFAGLRQAFRPQVDCFRTEHPPALTIVVELPGVDAEDVHVVATERDLVISGERRRPSVRGAVYQQMEIEHGRFERHVALGADVDTAQASASYESGMLTIVLPLAPHPGRPVKVPIPVESRP